MRLLFCLFADNIGLLPKHVFRALILSDDRFTPRIFLRKLKLLFTAMSEPDGIFGEHTIKYFNGGLFDSDSLIAMDLADLAILHEAASKYNWSHVAPEIFGTLFERSLNAERRSLIGAHYTSAEDILLLVEPVVMRPLEQRWANVRASILTLLGHSTPDVGTGENPGARGLASETWDSTSPLPSTPTPAKARTISPRGTTPNLKPASPKSQSTLYPSHLQAESLLAAWFDELSQIRILDPACGSGNFLYVALRRLLDLWNEARTFAVDHNLQLGTSYAIQKMVSPHQLFGIEIEFYAHELASIVVWIGFLQWKRENSILDQPEPILQKLDNIQHADAILRYDHEGKPYEPQWPPADFIIGNPPFLGTSKMKKELGISYCDDLRVMFRGRVPGSANLVIYWFEKARAAISRGPKIRAGLIATQAIRAGSNRTALTQIKQSGDIFEAWSNRKWILKGASVRVSLIGFDNGDEAFRRLDGETVDVIHANLTSGVDITSAKALKENLSLAFEGVKKYGDFEVSSTVAQKMLRAPLNPNGEKNDRVLAPWYNADDLTDRPLDRYIVDFGTKMAEIEAALYELPFQYVYDKVRPERLKETDQKLSTFWWRFERPRPALRKAINQLSRCIATPRVSKYRSFCWKNVSDIPDTRVLVIARSDDYMMGILTSLIHESWSLSTSSRHGVAGDITYNKASCFDTFPFPWPPGTEPSEADSPIVFAVAEAARNLVKLRDAWLNPPGASESDLKDRTLTKLYNLRAANKCAWLENAHRTLDQAVFAAYNWPNTLTTQEILFYLLALNHDRATERS